MSDASQRPALVWLRQDLRLADNPALATAAKTGARVAFVYVLDDKTPGRWKLGAASRWWLHRSLEALSAALAKRGARLILRRGDAAKVIPALAKEIGAAHVFWSRCYEPYAIARDTAIKAALLKAGVAVESVNAALFVEPWEMRTGAGEPYKVFTPFWRAVRAQGALRAPIPPPKQFNAFAGSATSDDLASWKLLPTKPNWASEFEKAWKPGEAGAHAALDHFLDGALSAYPKARDRADIDGTSRLSPHLHWGELSPAQAAASATAYAEAHGTPSASLEKFLAELGWREFSHHLLFHWRDLPSANWKPQFDAFPWANDEARFAAWTRGETGYPMVDAGMRQLWRTGWMHNRVRMIAASFLIKDLMIDWRRGADWFWDTLVDADLANNSASWQWVAGSGADASPFFRIFNPVTQGETYDPNGDYVRRWAPELAKLPAEHIHAPWKAPAVVLREAGVTLGETYPNPIVDHAEARQRALEAFAAIKSAA
ncbi:MAG: deoxyribodipyrimidine photo-lyase [Hyphomonadaceae bacterium]